jgi:hypothetical protein
MQDRSQGFTFCVKLMAKIHNGNFQKNNNTCTQSNISYRTLWLAHSLSPHKTTHKICKLTSNQHITVNIIQHSSTQSFSRHTKPALQLFMVQKESNRHYCNCHPHANVKVRPGNSWTTPRESIPAMWPVLMTCHSGNMLPEQWLLMIGKLHPEHCRMCKNKIPVARRHITTNAELLFSQPVPLSKYPTNKA